MHSHDVSPSFVAKIYKTYGSDIIEVVKSNLYKLADDIWIIEFRTADSIAKKLGFEKNCFPRCRSGILYTLNQLADKGHVYAEKG